MQFMRSASTALLSPDTPDRPASRHFAADTANPYRITAFVVVSPKAAAYLRGMSERPVRRGQTPAPGRQQPHSRTRARPQAAPANRSIQANRSAGTPPAARIETRSMAGTESPMPETTTA